MYTLYYKPGACSMAVHVILNELGVPFQAINQTDLKDPQFMKLNPRGQVPLLVVDGEPVKEGAALMTWLLDEHKSKWMPASGLPRAKALEWLMWCNATLHPACGRIFGLSKLGLDETTAQTLGKALSAQVQTLWDEAEARLGTTKYLAGDNITAADILLTVIANWGLPRTLGPNVKRLIGEISQLPSYQKTLQAEGIEYKAAA